MKMYIVKNSQYKPLEGKRIGLQAIDSGETKRQKEPTTKDLILALTKRFDDFQEVVIVRFNRQDEFNQYVRDVFERNNLK